MKRNYKYNIGDKIQCKDGSYSTILEQTVGSAGKVTGNLRNSGFAVEKGNKVYVSSTIVTDPASGKKGIYEINSKGKATLIDENEYIKSINMYKGNLYYLAINPSKTGNYIRQVDKIKPNGEKIPLTAEEIQTLKINYPDISKLLDDKNALYSQVSELSTE